MLKIEILKAKIVEKKVPGRDGTKGFTFFEQPAWVYIPDENGELPPHPAEMAVSFETLDATPYPVGVYTLSPVSFYMGQYKRLELGKIKLIKASGEVRKIA